MMIFWRLMLTFFQKATSLDKYASYAALKEGAKVLSSTTLVLNRDDLKIWLMNLGYYHLRIKYLIAWI